MPENREIVGVVVDELLRHPRVQEAVDGLVGQASAGIGHLFAQFFRPQHHASVSPAPDRMALARAVMHFDHDCVLTGTIIKKRRKELAKKFHPDRPSGDRAMMARINDAAGLLLSSLRERPASP